MAVAETMPVPDEEVGLLPAVPLEVMLTRHVLFFTVL